MEQSRYEIEVAEQDGGRLVWQSGKVYSSRSNLVAYQGLPLEPCRAYRWRVRACTEDDKSGWSPWASFETGLMDASRWQARWIAGGEPASEMTRLPLMRRSFMLAGPVRSARVYASALGLYRLRINGKRSAQIISRPAGPAMTSVSSTSATMSPICCARAKTRWA